MSRQIFIFFNLIFLFFIAGNLKAQSWERLLTEGGGSGNELIYDMDITPNGDIYIVGTFTGSVDISGNSLTSNNGSSDFFLASYDSALNLKYVFSAGSPSNDFAYGVAVDANGNAYITGSFASNIQIGPFSLNVVGTEDAFTAKFDSAGNALWAKRSGSTLNIAGNQFSDRGTDICLDDFGGVYISGVYRGNNFNFGNLTLNGNGQDFVGKYNENGVEQWVVEVAASTFSFSTLASTIAYNPTTNRIIAGGEKNIGVFIGPGGTGRLSEGYLTALTTSGAISWTANITGSFQEVIQNIDFDAQGNIYVAGKYNGTLNFNSTFVLISQNDGQSQQLNDAFLLKFNPNGTSILIAKSISGIGDLDGKDVSLDASGNIYWTGFFDGGPSVDGLSIAAKGDRDIFICRLDPAGSVDWIETAGGTGSDEGLNIEINNSGKIINSGTFSGVAQFGNETRISQGFGDAYLAQLDCKPEKPSIISGDTVVCIGDTSIYLIEERIGTTNTWSLNGGGNLTVSSTSSQVIWNQPGTYEIEIAPNNVCGFGEPRVLSVRVRDIPSQALIAGDTSLCLGLGSYSAQNIDANNFNWTLSGGGSLVPLNDQALVSWSSPGTYTLSVVGTNACGTGPISSQTINVAQFPSGPVLISGNLSTCTGTDTFSVNTSPQTSYSWDVNGGAILNAFDSFAVVNWTEAGTYVIRVTPSNICGTANPSSQIVSVSAQPDTAVISGDTLVCVGSNSYTMPSINNATYNWSISGGGNLLNLGNNAVVNWVNPGDYIITSSITNQCGTSITDTFNVSVRSSSIQPEPIQGNTVVCKGSESYLVAQQQGQVYTWSLSSGGTLNFVGNQASIDWTETGVHNITVSTSNECGIGQSRTLSVEVRDVPDQPGVIFGDDDVCLGLENYNVFAESGISYSWSVSGGGLVFPSANSSAVNWTSTGVYDLIVTPSNACGSGTPRIASIEVNDVPDDINAISGLDSVCLGTQIYNVENPQTAPDLTYSWTLSGGGLIAPNGSSATVNWSSPGDYTLSVRAQNQCGFGNIFSDFVNVRNTNDQLSSIVGDDIVCLDTLPYEVPFVSGLTYNWDLSGGGSISADSNKAVIVWDSIGDYLLSVSTSDGCSKSLQIEVKDIPTTPSSIFGDSLSCFGSKSYAVEVGQDENVLWNISGGGNINPFGTAAIVNWTDTGMYQIIAEAQNLCGISPSSILNVNVLTIPESPEIISTDTLVCSGNQIAYRVAERDFETYSWSLNRAGLLDNQDSLIQITWLDTGEAILSVNATNICGTGTNSILDIEIQDVPFQPTINGALEVCLDTQIYSVPFQNNVIYNWSIDTGAVLNANNEQTELVFTQTGISNLELSLSNNCGSSVPESIQIEVKDIPNQPVFTSADTLVCLGFASYEIASIQGETYDWQISGGGSINALANTATINWTSTGFHEIYVRSNNLCGSSNFDTLEVEVISTPLQPAPILGNNNVCLDSQIYSVPAIAGLTYDWSLNTNGNLISGDSANVLVDWTNAGIAVLSVNAINICGTSPSQSLSITSNDLPGLPTFLSGDTLVCLGNENYTVNSNSLVTYNWTLNGGGVLSTNNQQATVNWNQEGNWILECELSNLCGTGPAESLSVRVKDIPDSTFFINPDTVVCLGNTIYEVNFENEVNYSWTLNGGGSFSTVNNRAFVTWNSPGIYTLQNTASNICGARPPIDVQIEVNTIPQVPQFLNPDSLSCLGPDRYEVIAQAGVDYLWNISGGGGFSSNSNVLDVNWTNTGDYEVYVSSFNFCGTSSIDTLKVEVNSIPDVVEIVNPDTLVCLDQVIYKADNPNSFQLNWTLIGGGSISAFSDSIEISWQSPGDYTISLRAENYCGIGLPDLVDINVQDLPDAPSNLIGSTSICRNEIGLYSVNDVAGNLYSWFAEGQNLSSDSSSLNYTWTARGEQILEVSAVNLCGEGPRAALSVDVRDVPDLSGNILGTSSICQFENAEYEIINQDGVNYNWSLLSGGELSSESNKALISWSENGVHFIELSAENACGLSETIQKEIVVDSFPIQPEIFVSNDTIFTNSTKDNVWMLDGTTILNTDLNFIIPESTGRYTVMVANACGESETSEFLNFYTGNDLAAQIFLRPNPANTFVEIEVPVNVEVERIEVNNSQGSRVLELSPLKSGPLTINVSGLIPGLYLIEIDLVEQGRFIQKLVVN